MKLYSKQFLGLEAEFTSFEKAAVVLVPFPYEGGVSYGLGTAKAPDAILDASCYLELYDEVLDDQPYRIGITTVNPPKIANNPADMIQTIYETTLFFLNQDKFVILIGGDHSITFGYFKAIKEKYGQVSVIQLDAHADLRNTYEGSPWSHACVMSRIREITAHTLQIGIRSLSAKEAALVKKENISLCTMHQFRQGRFDLEAALNLLPDPVFLTVDADVFDWSVIMSTGTPEPGGLLWDEGVSLLQKIFMQKNVIGFDFVELSYQENDRNSPYAAAKMIYKMIGFKFFINKNITDLEL
ncbi:MAG: agmatinase [Candidatus Marinimicrobia bacterium]|nr:agmatinase [Candidatus Neomarinimicrobiota bacterium]